MIKNLDNLKIIMCIRRLFFITSEDINFANMIHDFTLRVGGIDEIKNVNNDIYRVSILYNNQNTIERNIKFNIINFVEGVL